jgi:hypothetical protein
MKAICAVTVFTFGLATSLCAQTPAAPSGRSASALFSVRGFGLITEQSFSALDTFDAVFVSANGPFFGGGLQVVHRSGIFAEFSASWFRKTGERAFRSNGQSFRLGLPLTASVTPVEVTGGYRIHFRKFPRVVFYLGAGAGSYAYQETSQGSDPLDVRHAGYLALGGVEVRAFRWVAFTIDSQYTHIPGILGTGGVSEDAKEDDLGGTALRFRVIVGR